MPNAANFVIEEDDDDGHDEGMANDADGDIIEIIDMRGNQAGTSGSSLLLPCSEDVVFASNRAAASIDPKVDSTRGAPPSRTSTPFTSRVIWKPKSRHHRRPPKREWEGATLRNAETLCNSVLPVWTCLIYVPRMLNARRRATKSMRSDDDDTVWRWMRGGTTWAERCQ